MSSENLGIAVRIQVSAVHELNKRTSSSRGLHRRQRLVLAGMKLDTLEIDMSTAELDIGCKKVAFARVKLDALLQADFE